MTGAPLITCLTPKVVSLRDVCSDMQQREAIRVLIDCAGTHHAPLSTPHPPPLPAPSPTAPTDLLGPLIPFFLLAIPTTGQEKRYNPYYAFLAGRLCEFDAKFRFTLQLTFWDL